MIKSEISFSYKAHYSWWIATCTCETGQFSVLKKGKMSSEKNRNYSFFNQELIGQASIQSHSMVILCLHWDFISEWLIFNTAEQKEVQGSDKSHQFWLSLDMLFVQRLSAALHAGSVVGPCAHLHGMVINGVPFRCLVNANPPLALPFKWQIYDIKRELIWLLQLIYRSFFRYHSKNHHLWMKKAYFGYLELCRNLVSLVILGWIKPRNKMLVCQVLAWCFSGSVHKWPKQREYIRLKKHESIQERCTHSQMAVSSFTGISINIYWKQLTPFVSATVQNAF